MVTEITGKGEAIGYAGYQFMNSHGYTADSWENASDIETATEAFCWCFERPSEKYAHVEEQNQLVHLLVQMVMDIHKYIWLHLENNIRNINNMKDHTRIHHICHMAILLGQ